MFEFMGASLRATGEAIAMFVVGLPLWSWGLLLVALALTAVLVVLRLTRQEGRAPEMMLSRAELAPDDTHEGLYHLVAAFSNMHYEPVQLLRIAVHGANGQARVVETTALVGPRRAVELEASVPITPGGSGRLDLYLYVPAAPSRAWRLSVPLGWEPWSQRFKAAPLGQKLTRVRRLPEEPPPPQDPESGPTPPDEARRPGGPLGFPDDF